MIIKNKTISKLLVICLLVQIFLGTPPVFASTQGMLAVVCDEEICSSASLLAYVSAASEGMSESMGFTVKVELVEIDYQKYNARDLDDLPEEMIQLVVRDVSEQLESFYRAEGLIGVLLVGQVPIPDVEHEGNVFKSVYPYMDFDDKALVYQEEAGHFVSTGSDPKAEIWSGVIREAEGTNLDGFFSKASSYHAGAVDLEQRMFYENLPELETLKKQIQDKTEEEKEEAWESYMTVKEELIGRSGRWMTANRASDGYDEEGQKQEPFEPELGEIDLSEDVMQYFRNEIDERRNSYEVAFNTPKYIIEYMGLLPLTDPSGYAERPEEFEDKMNEVLADMEVPKIDFFCPMWGMFRMVVPSRRSQWTLCTEEGTGFAYGNYRVDLFGCTDAAAWWQLHNLIAGAGQNGAMVVPRDGADSIMIKKKDETEPTLLRKKAAIIEYGDTIYPGTGKTLYYWDEPGGEEDVYEQGYDELFEDENGDMMYQEGENIDLGANEILDMPEDEEYKTYFESTGREEVLVIYFDNPEHIVPEDAGAEEGFWINNEWDPWEGMSVEESAETGGGGSAGSVEEFKFWTELFYMSWDDAEKLLAQVGVPAWGKYESDESNFELHYLISDFGDKYMTIAEQSTNHRADSGSDPPLFDCEFEGGCDEELNGWADFNDAGSVCWKDRKKLGTIALQIAEGWRAGWIENKTPENSFGAYAIAGGKNLAFLARTVEPVQMTVEDGKINISNDTGEVFEEETNDIAGTLGSSIKEDSSAKQEKLESVVNGGGDAEVNPAQDSSSGFGSDPFILSFAAGTPIGEALRISGWDLARILYGDPTLALSPVSEQ